MLSIENNSTRRQFLQYAGIVAGVILTDGLVACDNKTTSKPRSSEPTHQIPISDKQKFQNAIELFKKILPVPLEVQEVLRSSLGQAPKNPINPADWHTKSVHITYYTDEADTASIRLAIVADKDYQPYMSTVEHTAFFTNAHNEPISSNPNILHGTHATVNPLWNISGNRSEGYYTPNQNFLVYETYFFTHLI